MDGLTILRVYNNTNYDIGITLSSGQKPVIRTGSFLPITVNDILYIESTALRSKPFSSRLFVIKNNKNEELTLEDVGGFTDPYAKKHFDADEIAANLSKSAKAIAAWLADIEDPIELDAIRDIAEKMDLQGSKLKVIQAKIPNKNLLEPDEE